MPTLRTSPVALPTGPKRPLLSRAAGCPDPPQIREYTRPAARQLPERSALRPGVSTPCTCNCRIRSQRAVVAQRVSRLGTSTIAHEDADLMPALLARLGRGDDQTGCRARRTGSRRGSGSGTARTGVSAAACGLPLAAPVSPLAGAEAADCPQQSVQSTPCNQWPPARPTSSSNRSTRASTG